MVLLFLLKVCEEYHWDSLLNSQWVTLNSVMRLLQPFANYTQLLTSEKAGTISAIVPALMELDLHLSKVEFVIGLFIKLQN